MSDGNPLISDRLVQFLLYEVFDAPSLCELPHFEDHSAETFDLYLGEVRRLAREELYPTYRPMDEQPAHFDTDHVETHPVMRTLWPKMVELGLLNAHRPFDVGGQQLPLTVAALANVYVMAANAAAYGYCMLTTGSAHLIEAFGSDELKETFMARMYAGEFTGTMALTEPQAGSNLADVQCKATPAEDGHYLMQGSKVFISAGDHTLCDNIVHLMLARIEGAPAGIRGVSLFAVPKLRAQGDEWIGNDVHAAGAFHKMGWRGMPSIALNVGDNGDCHGYLVGQPHRGIQYMFQMMNEARIHIGIHGTATAMVAYQESLQYAKDRPQGRRPGMGAEDAQVAIIEHADVRRMLLRQKAITEGGLAVCVAASRYADLAEHGTDEAERASAQGMLDLLTPIAKTFPAERGFESNVLAVQVHGGYGYTSEYLPEAWLRDQKLNSIHEGTTGIQSQDLLARKVLRTGGQSLELLSDAIGATAEAAIGAGLQSWAGKLERANTRTVACARALGVLYGESPDRGLSHTVDFMDLMCTLVVGWQWLRCAAIANAALSSAGDADRDFYQGQLMAARYWLHTELPRIDHLANLCETAEDSYLVAEQAWF